MRQDGRVSRDNIPGGRRNHKLVDTPSVWLTSSHKIRPDDADEVELADDGSLGKGVRW